MPRIDFKDCKIICICEGRFEEDLINFLLEHDKLKFKVSDLVDEKVTRIRSAAKIQQNFLNRAYNQQIIILRIIDSKKERFNLAPAYELKIKATHNVVTKPEIEILVIIDKDDFKKFQEQNKKPSEYCKAKYGLSDIKKEGFVKHYFKSVEVLISAIKKYKTNNKDNPHVQLADLLK